MAIGLLSGREMVIQVGNDKIFEVWGKDKSITGLPISEALPELQGQVFISLLEGVYDTGAPFFGQGVLAKLMRQGQLEEVYFDFVYTPLRDTDEQITGVMVLATEVTQQVLARQRIEASEAKLRSVIASAPAGMGLLVGRDLVVELLNQTFIDIVGKGLDIVGKPLQEVMPELLTENQPFLQILDQVYTSGQMFQSYGSQVSIVQQGVMTHKYYNITYTPLLDETGQVYAILDIAIDVTPQVKAQQALAEAESSLRVAVELAQLGTWSIDVATGGLTFSDRLIEWFGYDPGAQDYNQVIPILEAGDQERVDQAVAWALHPDSDGVYNEIYTVIHPNTGHKRILHAQGKTVFDSSGKAIRLNGTAQDITIQRELQLALENQVQLRTEELAATNEELTATNEELEAKNEEYATLNEELAEANELLMRSNENLQTFAYVASHDLQEPLRKIQQFGDLLTARYAGTAGEERIYVDRMQLAATRMSTLIKDLLDFSRISTQREANAQVSLDDILQQVLITLELTIHDTGAQVSVDPLPTVMGDASQLNQLFQNLLSNALKFRRMDQAGVPVVPIIAVKANWLAADHLPEGIKPDRRAIAYHRIEVIDNGIGFDEKYLDRIFQVFQRLHGKSEYGGTGIGLAICQKVVFNHGGAITATSQPGQGATFTIYLPA